MIPFVIPDGSNFRTAILPEAGVARFYIDETEGGGGERECHARYVLLSPSLSLSLSFSLCTAETVLLLLKLSLVNPRTSRSSDRAGGVVGAQGWRRRKSWTKSILQLKLVMRFVPE